MTRAELAVRVNAAAHDLVLAGREANDNAYWDARARMREALAAIACPGCDQCEAGTFEERPEPC